MRAFFVPAARLGRGLDLRKLTSKKLLPSMVILGLVPAVSPLGMCLHIPFMNQVSQAFNISLFSAQAIVTVYMLFFALAIFATAFVADLVSKRTILLVSLFLFSAASLIGTIAWTYEVLLVARALQALAAGFAVVMPYAILQENGAESDVARSITTVSVFHSIASSLAPLLGGILTWFVDFRIAFAFVSIYALYLLVCVFHSDLGKRTINHQKLLAGQVLKKARMLLSQRNFLCALVIISCSSSLYYGFLSIAPALFFNDFGKSDFYCGFGIFVIAAFWTIGNRLSYRWLNDFGYKKALLLAVIVMSVGMVPLLFYFGPKDPFLIFILMLPYAIGGGIINTVIVSQASSFEPQIPGVASALLFAVQTLVGALSGWFFGFFDLRSLQDICSFGLFSALVCLMSLSIVAQGRLQSVFRFVRIK